MTRIGTVAGRVRSCAPMPITVREARNSDDLERAAALMRAVYVGEGWTQPEPAQRNMTAEKLAANGTVLLAEQDGKLSGAVIHLHADSPLRQLADGNEREFRLLAVAAEARGQGAGERLVQECVRRAAEEGATAVVLWTQPRMVAAQRLYERLGFVRDPARDVPDPRGFARLVYVRPLGGSPG